MPSPYMDLRRSGVPQVTFTYGLVAREPYRPRRVINSPEESKKRMVETIIILKPPQPLNF